MTRSNSASVTSRKSLLAETAALLTRMSTAPNFRTVKATSALTSAAFETSQCLKVAPSRFAEALPSLSSTSASTTVAPSFVSRSAMARPMPRAAPVTMAMRFFSFKSSLRGVAFS